MGEAHLDYSMSDTTHHLYLEHDGKVLLVDAAGQGPQQPQMGRTVDHPQSEQGWTIRLPTQAEVTALGIKWELRRVNHIALGDKVHTVLYALPTLDWPEGWAWKDEMISDSAVHPLAREAVYRSMHRLVSKVIVRDPEGYLLMLKVKRGFFRGCWTLCGGFLDYDEHPRQCAARELSEEVGIVVTVPDPAGEAGPVIKGNNFSLVQSRIFTDEGINWVSFTYLVDVDLRPELHCKPDEIEEGRWFSLEEAQQRAVSLFDIEALRRLESF
jgi:8-oxo-dGTP pyrophosphatase MutT (NUDIX family)